MLKQHIFRQAKINYKDTGKGRVIVLLHGFMESLDMWDYFQKELSKNYRVISIDLPGFGKSESIGYMHSMDMMAKCVKEILTKEQLRRFVFVGHSMGGYVALAFAELFPDNVSGLCLFHSTAMDDSAEKKIMRDRTIAVIKKHSKQFISSFFEPLFSDENRNKHLKEIDELKKNASSISPTAIANALEGMKNRPRRDWLLNLATFPMLFIIGKKDSAIDYESVLKQTLQVKYKEVKLLEHVGHMGFIEAQAETFSIIKKFTGKVFRNRF